MWSLGAQLLSQLQFRAPPRTDRTVTFTGLTYNGVTPVTTTLASNISVDASGQASFTTSSLAAGGAFHGSHFITATYSGDANHSGAAVTMVQKVHASASTLALVSSPNPSNFGQTVVITATVSSLRGRRTADWDDYLPGWSNGL